MSSPQLKSHKNYRIIKSLGSKAFRKVYKIRVHEDNKEFAVTDLMLNRPEALADAIMEYKLLHRGIPNVLKSFGSHHEENKNFLFSTEYMEKNLQDYIEVNGPLPFEKFIPIFIDIIRGIFFFFFSKMKKHILLFQVFEDFLCQQERFIYF